MVEHDPRSGGRPRPGEVDADQVKRRAAEREADLDAREDSLQARESADADRMEGVQGILDDATERDSRADARDSSANNRDSAASLHSFLHDDDLGPGLKARRSAELDRSDSKADRTSAAQDRIRLTGNGRAQSDPDDT